MPLIYSATRVFQESASVRQAMAEHGLRVVSVLDQSASLGRVSRARLHEALLSRAPEMEYLAVGVTPLTADFFRAAPKLRLVCMFGVGVDHIDMAAATASGIPVANAPGANARSVAELVLGLMLGLARRIPQLHNELLSGSWRRLPGQELCGKTLGLVGFGHTGRAVARLGRCLGMRVLAWMRHPDPQAAGAMGVELASLDDLLAASDIVSLHVPGGPDKALMGERELGLMRPGALLINTARGSVVDYDSLCRHLIDGRLGGAGLDVFPAEPPDVSHPLFSLPHVLCTPHIGAMTRESFEAVSRLCLEAVLDDVAGRMPAHVLNPDAYRHPRWQGMRAPDNGQAPC